MKQYQKITAVLVAAAMTFCTCFAVLADEVPEQQNEQAEQTQQQEEFIPDDKYTMTNDGEMAQKLVQQAVNYILQRYKFDTSKEELCEKALMKLLENYPELTESTFEALFSSLDDYSAYYTQSEYDYFNDELSGVICGIGVMISATNYGLIVSSVIDNSPAKDAGIKAGDIIVSANGTDIVGMPIDLAKSYILGEEGTTVVVGLNRSGEYIEFCVERHPVSISPGSYEILDNNIGYICIEEFNGTAAEFVNEALDKFDITGIKNIIIDLRNNPGGAVSTLVGICQRLIPVGPVIHFEYKNPFNNTTLYSKCQNPKYKIIVLANENSASASEAFCGAVQDSGVGIVIGKRTFGKGTMQSITDFKIGGGVKLTEAEYLTRNKRHINGKGIEPDVDVVDGTTTLAKAGFNDLDFEKVYTIGDKGDVVLGINQRLNALGYDVGAVPKDEYTEKTYYAIMNFQSAKELYPYGECDISTQLALEDILQTYEIPDNASFKEAIRIFSEDDDIDKYKVDWTKE